MNVQEKLRAVVAARLDLSNAVMDSIAEVATEAGLHKMEFLSHRDRAWRNDDVVAWPNEIDALLDIYCKNVNRNGFVAIWNREKGWK
tara:strand:- start:3383 stop:3643 length:261 start_codon:yes stop_codon:yes gene_type:complete